GRDGKSQGIEEHVGRKNAFPCSLLICPLRNLELPFPGARHSLFVYRSNNNARAVSPGEIEDLKKPWLPILVVCGVQETLAAGMLKTCFHLLPFSGVEHQGYFDIRHQPRGKLVHIYFAIAAHEVDVYIQYVRAFLLLFTSQGDQPVPIFTVEQIAHLFRTTRVYSFADD